MTVHTSDIRDDDAYGKAGDAIHFLQLFDPNGWHNLGAFDPFSGKPIDFCTFAPGAGGNMADWINRHIDQHNLYFSVGEPKPKSPNKKLTKQDIARVRALSADLDPEGGVEEFDSERARIRLRVEELQRGPLPPSFLVDSGGGMQVFWKLDEPLKADPAIQERVENVGRAIAHALKADAVQNVDRIMRLPGTTNFPSATKQRKGRTVRPTVLLDANGIAHGLDDIAKEFPILAGERARSRAEAADWSKYSNQIDYEEVRQLDAYADLSGGLVERFSKLLADEPKLCAMWEHGEKEGGRTGSDYVYALGMSLHRHGFCIDDFARLARVWRFTSGSSGRDVNASPRAIGRIWAKAEAMRNARTESRDPPPRQAGDPGAKREEDFGSRRCDSRNTDFGADGKIKGQNGWDRQQSAKGPFYKGMPSPIERDLLDIVLEPDKARDFPLAHLPPFIRGAVEAQVRWVKVPVSLAAHCTLSACSYAAMRLADVVAPCYVDPRPLSLFMMVVALTGERKSTLDRAVMSVVYALEEEAIANLKADLRQYTAAKASYDAEVRKLTTGKAGRELTMEARETQIAALKEPQEPLEEIVITGSPTVEGVYRLLNVGRGIGALLTAEGAQFLGGHGMADTAKLRTLADLSALWDNGNLTRQRAGESSKIFNKRLMASLALQPIIASSLLADQLAIHQGFLGRFFICHPESTIGWRSMEVNRLLTDDRMVDFERRIGQLVARPLSLKAGRRNELDLPGIHIREDTGAWELFQHFANGIEEGCRRDGPFFGVLSIAQKLAENVARLAAILTIMSDPTMLGEEERRIVSDEAMASAVHIGGFYLGEAIRLVGRKPEDAETTAASELARWLRTDWKHEQISPTLMQQFAPTPLRANAEITQERIEKLVRAGVLHLKGRGSIAGIPYRETYQIMGRQATT